MRLWDGKGLRGPADLEAALSEVETPAGEALQATRNVLGFAISSS